MSFSYSGGVITQTGTDTDLGGLSGLTGVTITNLGPNDGGYRRRVVTLLNTALQVSGTLTIETDTLIINRTDGNAATWTLWHSHVTEPVLNITGTLILGTETTVTRSTGNVTVRADSQPSIILRRYTGTSWMVNDQDFNVQSGGTFECYGGYVETTLGFNLFAGGTLKVRDGLWNIMTFAPSAYDSTLYVNCYLSGVVDIINWEVRANGNTLIGFLATAYTNFEGYKPINLSQPVGSVDGNAAIVDVNNYQGGQCPIDVKIRVKAAQGTNGGYDIFGSNLGNDLIVQGHGADQSRGRVWHYIRYKPVIEELDGTAISGAELYLIDSDSGSRDTTGPGGVSADQTYTKTSDGSGDVTSTDVLTGVWSNNNNTSLVALNFDNRLPINGRAWHYNFLPQVITINDSAVLGTFAPKVQMLDDNSITQATEATVLAYTTIDDLSELYDRAKAYKVDSANITYPTYTAFLGEASGSLIDFGALAVTVNSGAGSAFAVNTGSNLVTIKPTTTLTTSSKFQTITSTGNITFTTASIGDGLNITGTVFLNAAQDLTDVTITGDLHINTGADSTLTFDNVTVTGSVFNDAASNTLTINSVNGSSLTAGDPGTGIGQSNIQPLVNVTITCIDTSGSPIENARVLVRTALDTVINSVLTNASGVATASFSGSTPVAITGSRARKASSSPYYKSAPIVGTITSNGFEATITMLDDE